MSTAHKVGFVLNATVLNATEPAVRSSMSLDSPLWNGPMDVLSLLFDSLRKPEAAQQLLDDVERGLAWEHWVDASHASCDGLGGVRIYGPLFEPDVYVELPTSRFQRLLQAWIEFLADGVPRSLEI